jgi:uncharacterized protein (TIGR02145 family)
MKTKIFRKNKNVKTHGRASLTQHGRASLLLALLLCPIVLAAQNGVTVSNLVVNAGTVTFNVSWKTPMPVSPWSDTVWVFVDYNDNGAMKRLPVTGATASAGTVTKISGNDKGVWVIGNARSAGSFSATVKLISTDAMHHVSNGMCAYASNYPPAGKYISKTEISFTGTPMYDIVLKDGSSAISIWYSTGQFTIPPGYTVQSFSDKTGAPGKIKCIPMTGDIDFLVPSVSKSQQVSFVVNSAIITPDPALIMYSWSAPYFNPITYEGNTFTATTSEISGTYSVTLTAHAENYCDIVKKKDVEVSDCTALGATVNFTAFAPCSTASTGATWTLQDTRESNNNQNYKVKKLADGHIWMVQDLKFGDKCNKTTFAGSDGKDQTGKVTSLIDKTYYGDCTNVRTNNTPSNRGYMYDWAAAINKPGAYRGSSTDVGCTGAGSTANACQGICPEGWHVPTADANGDYQRLLNAYPTCTKATSSCWMEGSDWEAGYNGSVSPTGTVIDETYPGQHYITSSQSTSTQVCYFRAVPTSAEVFCMPAYAYSKANGLALRCVMNY